MTDDEMHEAVTEAYGATEADRLIIAEFGSIRALYDHAVAIDLIIPE